MTHCAYRNILYKLAGGGAGLVDSRGETGDLCEFEPDLQREFQDSLQSNKEKHGFEINKQSK